MRPNPSFELTRYGRPASTQTLGVTLSTGGHRAATTEIYSVEFFDLQLRFAAKVAELTGLPFTEAVGSHTNIYVRLGMGPRLDCANPEWIEYTSKLVAARDPVAWTYEVHLRRAHLPAGPEVTASVGCFSYALFGPGHIRLHFHPGHQLSDSPLSLANERLRRWELTRLLAEVVSSSPSTKVVGASWLYNLRACRRLFPARYLNCLKPIEHPYQRMPLWGQFLNRDRSIRKESAQGFQSRLARAANLAELGSCFPLRVLSATVPANWLLEQVGTQLSTEQ
jgi:hypothetical protein